MVSNALERALPGWLARGSAPVGSRDPLGTQARSVANADALLPGLSVHTSRARYYSFLCWALGQAERLPPMRRLDGVHRLERLQALLEALLHRDGPDAGCSFIGRRLAKRYVNEQSGSLWELPSKILKSQTSHGALRLYRSSLGDLGLVEEEPLGESTLGLVLTERGRKLGERYGRSVSENLIQWALGDGEARRKEASLLEYAGDLCLSARIDGFERRYLVTALFAESESAIRRAETVRNLLTYDLLPRETEDDDPDAEEDGGAVRCDWFAAQRALTQPDCSDLKTIQQAAAWELFALSLDSLVASITAAVSERGRIACADWIDRVGRELGAKFDAPSALAVGAKSNALSTADRTMRERLPWPERGALALRLLLAVLADQRLSRLVEASADEPFAARTLDVRRNLFDSSPRSILTSLVAPVADRHEVVADRKGKARWFWLDATELVRGDVRPFDPVIHTLRFGPMHRILTDLKLDPSEVRDGA